MKYQCYFDGSITKNPGGDMGIGGLIFEVNESEKINVHQFTENLPAKDFPNGTSCNVAEILALQKLLSYFALQEAYHESIEVLGDSQIVINRATRMKKGGKGIFIPFVDETIDLISQFSNIKFKWIPREQNTEADNISR